MALSKAIYRQYEDVVGPENISDDPAIMPAYHGYNLGAVVYPGNTKEVQAIVKLCNKHKIKFAALSTDFTGVIEDGTIYIDLRRMNRIIEINEQNMYAVVEPYVIVAELQAELFMKGLTCNTKGSGTQGTAILAGHGEMDQSTSCDDRNILACEWVTPQGEIVRSGALGSADEWFCGDGPGPSLRCLINTAIPPLPSPGVLTKLARKCYHWAGPSSLPVEGVSPRYTMSDIPPNMMADYFSFPSVEELYEAERKIGESEIADMVMGYNPAMMAANVSTNIEATAELYGRISKEVQGPGFYVMIFGISDADFKYKTKVLAKIIEETGGKHLSFLDEPDIEGMMIAHATRVSKSIRETYRTGGLFTSIPIISQRDLTIRWAVGAGKAKLPLIEKGLILDDGGGFFGWGVEHGHLGKTEIFCVYDPSNAEARAAVLAWRDEQAQRAFRERYFAPLHVGDPAELGPGLSNFHIWSKKIRDMLDPNDVAAIVGLTAT